MGWRLIKQPNGLYARFSDVEDDFTQYNMSQEEVLQIGAEFWDVSQALLREKIGTANDDPQGFNEAIDVIRRVHGKDRAEEKLERLSAAGERKKPAHGNNRMARTSNTSLPKETEMTCPDCGKEGIKRLAMHKRFCPGKKGKKANAGAAAKKARAAAAKKKTPLTDGTNVAALLLSKAEEHRATAADLLEKAEKLEDMAKEAESLL